MASVLRRGLQERFNAFSLIDADAALAIAKESTARWRSGAPLSGIDGVPTTIKDIVWVKDRAVRYGSRTTSTTPCTQDAPSVKRLRAGGAVLIGLTTTPEFGWKAITDSPLTGVTRNPWNPKMTPGGSSGGAVVAAATGAGVLHIGTDGGGSIRIPSSLTGMVGLKPTFGRVAAYPPSAFGTVAHIGPIGRSAEDAAAMLGVIAGRDIEDWNQGVGELPLPCELQDRGFIECVTPGAFSRKIRHAAEWRLTHLVCDASGRLPGKPFMRWRPTEKQNTVSIRSVTVANESQSPSIKWSDRL
jgi:aspartyl-tRNA(Asn)/glutamyl-tRNA(Gln) amidotransferase subunit A